MDGDKFPASVPRKMYWSHKVGGCSSCPDCGTQLASEYHAYVLATRGRRDVDLHVMGSSGGHFCEGCAVVVLDQEDLERFVSAAMEGPGRIDYTVLGIVDMDAVPADKRNLPFDDDSNPLPLVRFTNISGQEPAARSRRGGPNKHKRKGKKKRR